MPMSRELFSMSNGGAVMEGAEPIAELGGELGRTVPKLVSRAGMDLLQTMRTKPLPLVASADPPVK